jgi:nicotinamide riboside kinase
MKIAIIGTHGVGKTTLSYQIAAEAKKTGKNACVIQELARLCPFPINDGFSIEAAEWIITTQVSQELAAKARGNDCIICDRSAFDPILYLAVKPFNPMSYEKLQHFAEEWLRSYDALILVKPVGQELIDDGIRSMDRDFYWEVNKKFMDYFRNKFPGKLTEIRSSEIFSNKIIEVLRWLGLG